MYTQNSSFEVENEYRKKIRPSLEKGESSQSNKLPDRDTNWQIPLFEGLGIHGRQMVAQNIIPQRYGKKECIYSHSQNSRYIYFIKAGNVVIGHTDKNGKEVTLDILGPGEMFGALPNMEKFDGHAWTKRSTLLYKLDRYIFNDLLQTHPSISVHLLNLFTTRAQLLEKKLVNMIFREVKARICDELFTLYKKFGNHKNGEIRIQLTHYDVAKLVGCSRETASLSLKELREGAIISIDKHIVRILSLYGLRKEIS